MELMRKILFLKEENWYLAHEMADKLNYFPVKMFEKNSYARSSSMKNAVEES